MTKFTIGHAWREQRRTPTPVESFFKGTLAGRIVVVTGANVGLGFEAAKHFAALGPAKLVLAVRTVEKGEAAKRLIVEATGVDERTVEVWQLDLASFESVKKFAQKAKTLPRLDVVLENAGFMSNAWTTTVDGHETALQTNVISTGLLGLLLIPLLQRTANLPALDSTPKVKPHLTIVASEMHFVVRFKEGKAPHPIEALDEKAGFDAEDRYPVTKLLEIFMARHLATTAGESVIVNTCTPGFCQSDLDKEMGFLRRSITRFARATIGRTTEVGSRPLVWAATQDTPSGVYTANCEVQEESDYVISDEGKDASDRVWADLKTLWTEVSPESRAILR